jgi:aerobic-type carbon monoxide dehydrogenase small subunit (CoxS/CutS family)
MSRSTGPERSENGRVSRRGLFKGAGIAAAAAALSRPLDALARETEGEVRTQGPGPVTFRVRLNGKDREVTAEPRQTLLEALRLPPLDLTGAKPVCDRGQCGACTVWLDGQTVYACTVLALEAEGREVTTVEGLGTPDALHPVQAAFVAKDAMQCGFCTPGMVMSCAFAVKTRGKGLTLEQARDLTVGNLCRCGTYPHVLEAALAAAKGA